MRGSNWRAVPWLIGLFISAGCGPAMDYRPGVRPRLFNAPAAGVYELYRSGSHVAVHETVLLHHDRVGFRRDGAGRLMAIAAGERIPLREGEYRWKFEGYFGKRGPPGGVDLAGLLSCLTQATLEDFLLGTAEIAVDAGLRASSEQGLTKYQKRKLRESGDEP